MAAPNLHGRPAMAGEFELHGRVAVVTLDNPPVNGLGHALRTHILAALDQASTDPAVEALVLIGTGKNFSAGADVREFGTARATAEPTLRTLISALEESAKPVVAAINGTCMGGGLELALGCHYRVALSTAMLALPEVKLGLLPGAGGTQRLPRAVGVELALDLIGSGRAVKAAELGATGLLDAVVEADLLGAALASARHAASVGGTLPRLRDRTAGFPKAGNFFRTARDAVSVRAVHYPAAQACVEAVEASIDLPFEEGLRFERERFERLMQTTQSRALRHAFFAEREAARIADLPATVGARKVERVAVVGAGTMGTGIAVCFLDAGLPVTLVESDANSLDKALATMRSTYDGMVAKGKLVPTEVARRLGLLTSSTSLEAVAGADLVVEAVFEDMAIKREVFAQLDRLADPGAMLATNTSTLDVDVIAAATRRPADVVGLHFFSPAQVMKLLEVVRATATGNDVLAGAMQVARRIGKTAVLARVCDGFIGNRMVEHYLRQAMFLVEEGASPEAVDLALERFGMAMGPFRMSDLAGNDVGWRIRQRRYAERPNRVYPRIADRLCELGRFGQKTGAGWYRYEAGRRDALPDPAVAELVDAHRRSIGQQPRSIPEEEIVDRCILALVNEGARVLEEGIAQRASDIDVVYLTGYGFPRFRGGPLFYADTLGLAAVARRLRELAAAPIGDAPFFAPALLVERLAADGGTFNQR